MNDPASVIFGGTMPPTGNWSDCASQLRAHSGAWHTYGQLLPPAPASPASAGSVAWGGRLVCSSSGIYWNVTSIASVASPTGAAPILRRTTARVPLTARTTERPVTSWGNTTSTSTRTSYATTTTYDSVHANEPHATTYPIGTITTIVTTHTLTTSTVTVTTQTPSAVGSFGG